MMKVAKFRQNIHFAIEHCSVHYHSCVGIREIENWIERANLKYSQISNMKCKRAKSKDLIELEEAKDLLTNQVIKARNRIEILKTGAKANVISILH